jgi:hypothetical protein
MPERFPAIQTTSRGQKSKLEFWRPNVRDVPKLAHRIRKPEARNRLARSVRAGKAIRAGIPSAGGATLLSSLRFSFPRRETSYRPNAQFAEIRDISIVIYLLRYVPHLRSKHRPYHILSPKTAPPPYPRRSSRNSAPIPTVSAAIKKYSATLSEAPPTASTS